MLNADCNELSLVFSFCWQHLFIYSQWSTGRRCCVHPNATTIPFNRSEQNTRCAYSKTSISSAEVISPVQRKWRGSCSFMWIASWRSSHWQLCWHFLFFLSYTLLRRAAATQKTSYFLSDKQVERIVSVEKYQAVEPGTALASWNPSYVTHVLNRWSY